jgi:Ring finger domain
MNISFLTLLKMNIGTSGKIGEVYSNDYFHEPYLHLQHSVYSLKIFIISFLKMVAVVDLKEKYKVIDVKEERNGSTIAKHCMNSECTTFGLFIENTNKFIERFPEFEIKRKNVMVSGVKMDIIERNGIRKGEICPICVGLLEYVSKDFISTPCRHSFHFKCLFTIMMLSSKCPVCQTELKFKCENEEEKEEKEDEMDVEENGDESDDDMDVEENLQLANDAATEGDLAHLIRLERRNILPNVEGVNGALAHGHVNVVRWLLERNILPNVEGANDAVATGNLYILLLLAMRNILPDVNGANTAVKYGHLNILRWLLWRNILPTMDGANLAKMATYPNVLGWFAERNILPSRRA